MLEFCVSDEKKKKIGKIIKEKRIKKKLSYFDLSKEFEIQENYFKLLEEGFIYMINLLILKEISNILELNYLEFYYIADFIDENGIIDFISKNVKIKEKLNNLSTIKNEDILKINDYVKFVGIK